MARFIGDLLLAVAAIPFIYYAIALFSSWKFFRQRRKYSESEYTPPLSILKPVRGLDPDAYENFASFCVQDYPAEYEIIFCVGDDKDPVLPAIQKVIQNFPQQKIRVLFGTGRVATNDKVAKLARMVKEAAHEVVVINDSDVRARPDYLRTLVAPLADKNVGGVTPFYVSIEEKAFIQKLQSIGMLSDFYAGILVAWQLDGVKFALGPTIVTTKARLAGFGGYESIENKPADDLLVGRLIAEQGCEMVLLPYAIDTVADFDSFPNLFMKRLRWMTVMRKMRPYGHIGLIFTQGLAWALFAIFVRPTLPVALGFLGAYFAVRVAMVWMIAIHGLKQPGVWSKMKLIPVWDAFASAIWLFSFTRSTIRWRGEDYYLRNGMLVPAKASGATAIAERAGT
jgi:ceramide glucosyltransferase